MSDPASDSEISQEEDDVQDDDLSSTLTPRAVPSGLLKWLTFSLKPRLISSDPVDDLNEYHICRKGFEVFILASHLLLCLLFNFKSIYKPGGDCLQEWRSHSRPFETARTQQITVDNVGQFFRNNTHYFETTTLKNIAVYSTPLNAPFTSSKTPVRNFLQGQYLPVDYHAFVMFETSDGMWWALDKTRDGIFASCAKSRDSIFYYFQEEHRPEPLCLRAIDSFTSNDRDEYNDFYTYSSA